MDRDDVIHSLQRYSQHRAFTDGLSRAMHIADEIRAAFKEAALNEKVHGISYNRDNEDLATITVLQRDGEDIEANQIEKALGKVFADRGWRSLGVVVTTNKNDFADVLRDQSHGSVGVYYDRDIAKWLHAQIKDQSSPTSTI